ncbi:MAG: flagellar basal body P-ring formation protein FlgA [Hahellaceae bacterium]|nr:flagellar basal body P-ring formation protein FlgA [Hahellaceae bacterium]
MKIRSRILTLLTSFLLASSVIADNASTTPAQETQPTSIEDELTYYLSNYLQELETERNVRIEYSIGKIDPRLNLNACELPLEFMLSDDLMQTNRPSVKIVCNDTKSWSLYMQFSMNIFIPAVIVKSPLPRSYRLKADDLIIKEISADNLRRGYYQSIDDVVGMDLKRSIRADEAIYPGLLSRPQLISKGDAVMINATGSAIRVEVPGIAISDGKLGQQISVKNMASGKVIRAIVIDRQKVKVAL